MKKTEREKFDLANDIDFYSAIMDTVDGAKPLQKNPLQNVGDRYRLIEELEKYGFTITKLEN